MRVGRDERRLLSLIVLVIILSSFEDFFKKIIKNYKKLKLTINKNIKINIIFLSRISNL
jgi:hypothetical protein